MVGAVQGCVKESGGLKMTRQVNEIQNNMFFFFLMFCQWNALSEYMVLIDTLKCLQFDRTREDLFVYLQIACYVW